jgi:hypothetical protein
MRTINDSFAVISFAVISFAVISYPLPVIRMFRLLVPRADRRDQALSKIRTIPARQRQKYQACKGID